MKSLVGIGFFPGLWVVGSHMFPEKLTVMQAVPRIPEGTEGSEVRLGPIIGEVM